MVNSLRLGILRSVSPVLLRIRELRTDRGLTQEALAQAVGVRVATVSDLETNRSRRIELDLLERLAEALGVEPGDLFEIGDTPRRHR